MTAINNAVHNTYASQAMYSQTSLKASVEYFEITGGTYGTAYGDNLDVSESAKQLLDRTRQLDVFSCIFPGNDVRKNAKSLTDVKSDFLSDFNDFSKTFGAVSGLLGLGAGESFSIGLNGTGGMNIGGTDAAGVAALSETFNTRDGSTSTMTARFAVMAARAALVDAGATEPGFQDAYSQDPFSAITNNIDALKERLLGFKVAAGDGELQYGFTRKGEVELSEETVSYEYARAVAEAV